VLRIVPKIDLSGFEHHIVDCKIRLRNGILEELGTPGESRPRLDPRPTFTPAMIQEAIRIDGERLQGVWSLISGAVSGRPGGAEAKVRWTLAGDSIVVEMHERWVGKWTLDPTRSPKRINLAATSSDGTTTEVIRGVYEVRGDKLCICLAYGDEPRPENLRSSPGTSQVSLALKRQ
jgi:uncharacterized protein (TIGR03067 family)